MKIRNGFVSNSSTTSFCIYGICFERHSLPDEFREIMEKEGLARYCYDEDYFVGKDYTSMQMDQTRREFENSVRDEIYKAANEAGLTDEQRESLRFAVYSEAWYD